ncbi:MAG TPA: substrate-binding domain-containing protein, partial [Phototrophicaceae bacterium]|nr:substrate-binding domain-containing protein [Phototrophicaceae bacterium]
MNRRDFLKASAMTAAAGILAAKGLNPASAQDKQSYTMVTFLSGIDYWKDAYRGMQDAAEYLGVDVTYTGTPDYDLTAEVRVLDETIAQQPDGILLTVMQADGLQPSIDNAIAAGLPLVTFDADSPVSKRYAFLGTGNYYAGVVAARYIGPLIGAGKAAVITVPSQNNLALRTQGFLDTLKAEYPDAVSGDQFIVDNQNTAEGAATGLAALLQAEPDIKGVFSTNASAAVGSAQAIREAGLGDAIQH